jgi:hypothetical protein
MPEDFLLKLSALGDRTDEIIPRVLEVGGEVVLEKVKSNLESIVGRGTKTELRSTGELVGALGMTQVRLNREGNHDLKIGFAEPMSDGGSNAKFANISGPDKCSDFRRYSDISFYIDI